MASLNRRGLASDFRAAGSGSHFRAGHNCEAWRGLKRDFSGPVAGAVAGRILPPIGPLYRIKED